jgi:hypothetical protein
MADVRVTLPEDRDVIVLDNNQPQQMATILIDAAVALGLDPSVIRVQPIVGGFVAPASVVATIDTTPEPPVQIGDFTWVQQAPLVVTFTGLSVNNQGNQYQWDFGDGTTGTESTQKNPTHVYAAPGTYDVHFYSTDVNTPGEVFADVTHAVTVTG